MRFFRKKPHMDEESFLKLLDELKQKFVIVEGKKDKEALKTLGLKRIIEISGKPLIEIVHVLENNDIHEIVILTDFDKEGRKIESKLRYLLQNYKIKTDPRLRRKMMNIGKNKIEDFKNFLSLGFPRTQVMGSHIGGDIYGETSANINKIYSKSKDKSKRSNRKTRRNRSNIRSD